MAWYDLRTRRRSAIGPAGERQDQAFAFEATDDASAIRLACVQLRSLPNLQSARLLDRFGTQIWTAESPQAWAALPQSPRRS